MGGLFRGVKKMTVDDLLPLSRAVEKMKSSDWDILNRAIDGELILYAVNKSDKEIYYDYVVIDEKGEPQSIHPYGEEKQASKGKVLPLPLEQLYELKIGKSVTELDFFYWFDAEHKISHESLRSNIFHDISLADVWIEKTIVASFNQKIISKPKKKQYLKAIDEAIREIGSKASNENIYGAIAKLVESSDDYFDVDFEDVIHFNDADEKDIVLKNGGVGIKKKRFQNVCSEAKK